MRLTKMSVGSSLVLFIMVSAWAQPANDLTPVISAEIKKLNDALNEGKADAVVALFSDAGELIDASGRAFVGKEEMSGILTQFFTSFPGTKFSIESKLVRSIGSNTVIVDGTKEATPADGGSSLTQRFTAVYIRSADAATWQLGSFREFEDAEPAQAPAQLKSLEWMVGEWVDESPEADIKVSCRWSEDGNFLLRDFDVVSQGKVKVKSSQRIGYDAVTKQIRSWNFDSDGSFGEGVWSNDQNRWVVRTTTNLADGRVASALHTITLDGPAKITWHSSARFIGSDVEPDLTATIVRKTQPAKR